MQEITLQEVGGDLVINVPNESTVIGRGQFLQVTDKRVSRSHALLEVSDGKLYITPTHTNPCFLRTQNSKEQRPLARDVKQQLDHGDEFGLLPDQFFYRVSYPQLNGKERDDLKKEDSSPKEESLASGESVSNGIAASAKDGTKPQKKEASEDLDESRKSSTSSLNNEEEKDEKEHSSEDENKEDNEPEKVTVEGEGDMTLPIKKKRALPGWMEKVAESPTKGKPPPAKKQKPAPASKKPGTKMTNPVSDSEHASGEEDEEEEYTSGKSSKGQKAKESDEEFEEEVSDDDYVPEKASKKKAGKAQKKRKTSDSEDDISDDDNDDDYSPKKSKSKSSKKTSKGKGSARAKKTPVRAPRSTPKRSRAKKKDSDLDEDEEEEALPRRRRVEKEEEESASRRPQRAARQKRGSYVDDPMIEEALEDFASEEEKDVNEDKDSDFMVEGEEESGSDWEKSATSSQKQKAPKGKSKGPPKGPTKRVASKKKKPRRASKAKDNSDEDDDEMEDDEPYVPRPSKRRGGTVSHESDESDEGGNKKKRRREPCQYGKKCYRKNPVHFRTFCHPGDSSFDEEDKDGASPKETSRKEKESRPGSEKPSRPQRSTAGTRLVTHGTDDDDMADDRADDMDEDNDEGQQHTDESGADDSDYVIEADAQERAKDGKKVQKNKKQAKAAGSE